MHSKYDKAAAVSLLSSMCHAGMDEGEASSRLCGQMAKH